MAEMTNGKENIIQQNASIISVWTGKQKCWPSLRSVFLDSSQVSETKPLTEGPRKLIKVALLGRSNAGKSTLINKILNLNICDVSFKTHTTRFPIRTALISGNTQLIFVDTPGLVTKKEFSRFGFPPSFVKWKDKVLNEVDIIAVMQEAHRLKRNASLENNLVHCLSALNTTKPKILIISKSDLVGNISRLLRMVDSLMSKSTQENENKDSTEEIKFSKSFVISAQKNIGVSDLVHYLLEQANEEEWILEEGNVCDKPLPILIGDLIRAKMLNLLPQEVPYKCKYEVEYLEENKIGELVCVAQIICKEAKHTLMIVDRKREFLKSICQTIESDLYSILRRVVKLRLVVNTEKKKSSKFV